MNLCKNQGNVALILFSQWTKKLHLDSGLKWTHRMVAKLSIVLKNLTKIIINNVSHRVLVVFSWIPTFQTEFCSQSLET